MVLTICSDDFSVKNGVRQHQFVGAVVLHVGANDVRLQQTEVLKDYRSLIETVHSTSPDTPIIVSGPLPTCRQGQERRDLMRAFIPAESEQLFSTPVERRLDACELLDRRSALESSRADAHKSVVNYSLTDFIYSMHVSAQEDVIISGFIHSGTDTTPWIKQRKTRARTRARTSPPPPPLPVFEISTRNRFSPLCESERADAVIIGTSMVHVRATSATLVERLLDACELLDRRSALETSRADAHKSVVSYSLTGFIYSMRFSAQEDVIMSGFIHSGTETP
ncbi:hypothetical protein F2P79_023393 [Pimephales promelas]|nr:hypothetical protein F2P79_023393 [Pimephales promelas]